MPFDNDGLISWTMINDKVNAELANVYGNLVKRTIAMSDKYFGGVVERSGVKESVDDELIDAATSVYGKVSGFMDEERLADAIDTVFSLLRRANKYIDETAPWVLAKSEETLPRLKEVLYNLTEVIVIATSLLEPIMPDSCAKILKQLDSQPIRLSFRQVLPAYNIRRYRLPRFLSRRRLSV